MHTVQGFAIVVTRVLVTGEREYQRNAGDGWRKIKEKKSEFDTKNANGLRKAIDEKPPAHAPTQTHPRTRAREGFRFGDSVDDHNVRVAVSRSVSLVSRRLEPNQTQPNQT